MTLTPEKRLRIERAATAARLFDEVRGRPMIDPDAPPDTPPIKPADDPKPVKLRDGEQAE